MQFAVAAVLCSWIRYTPSGARVLDNIEGLDNVGWGWLMWRGLADYGSGGLTSILSNWHGRCICHSTMDSRVYKLSSNGKSSPHTNGVGI